MTWQEFKDRVDLLLAESELAQDNPSGVEIWRIDIGYGTRDVRLSLRDLGNKEIVMQVEKLF